MVKKASEMVTRASDEVVSITTIVRRQKDKVMIDVERHAEQSTRTSILITPHATDYTIDTTIHVNGIQTFRGQSQENFAPLANWLEGAMRDNMSGLLDKIENCLVG